MNDTVSEISGQSNHLSELADSTRNASYELSRSVEAVAGHMGWFKV